MENPIITLTSDFAVQSLGIGHMKVVAKNICPHATVVNMMHGIPDYNLVLASLVMESVVKIPKAIHVCVVDPGVGTARKAIIVQTARGDYFVGPDNGIFVHATRKLGGAVKVVSIENPYYMLKTKTHIFHGRDVFAPAAAYLADGVAIEQFGPSVNFEELVPAPYEDAEIRDNKIKAIMIWKNKFGSLHLNIQAELLDELGLKKGDKVLIHQGVSEIMVEYAETFGDVRKGLPLILKDDYGRTQLSVNQGNFAEKYGMTLEKPELILRKL